MPYNNTPITPPQEITGQTSLPLARVKKIIAADDDISACSSAAAFAIAIATEMFIQHLSGASHNIVKGEKKHRRTVAYRDVAAAVAKNENLEFIDDVVPRTMTWKAHKAVKAAAAARRDPSGGGVVMNGVEGNGVMVNGGQRTLEQMGRGAEEASVGMVGLVNGAVNGVEPASPNSVRSGGRYDAVRDEPMEED